VTDSQTEARRRIDLLGEGKCFECEAEAVPWICSCEEEKHTHFHYICPNHEEMQWRGPLERPYHEWKTS